MNIEQFKQQLFTEGQKQGFQEIELYYEKSESLAINVYEGEVDGYKPSSVHGASIRGLYEGKTGYAYTEKLDEDVIQFLLKNAAENAKLIEIEPESIFTEQATYENKQFYTPALEDVTPDEIIALLKKIEEKIAAYDERVVKTNFIGLTNMTRKKSLFHNKGLSLSEQNNFLVFRVSVLVQEDDVVKSASVFKVTKDVAELDAYNLTKEVVEKALSFLGEENYPNKNYPVLLENKAAASLLATFMRSFSAQAVQDDQSRLKGKLGEHIGSSLINLIDDPFRSDGLGSGTFDAEGVPTKKQTIVQAGQLQSFFHNLKTAKKDGVKSTGHASRASYKSTIGVSPSNFYVKPAEQTYDQIYATIDEGMIITNLAGLHSGANQISGDFSLAADGYYVKNGEIIGPARQMTIAGNFFDVLNDVEAIGNDLEFSPMGGSGYIGSPSLKIKSLAVTID